MEGRDGTCESYLPDNPDFFNLHYPLPNMNAIEVNNLTKIYRLYNSPKDRLREMISLTGMKYHHEFYALNDVSFTIEKGQTVGIMGKNGSGKSTLLKIICGVLQSSSGSVKVNGRISSLLELGAGFNPEFTGRENVYMNGALMGFTRTEMDRRFSEIESFADIGEFIDQPVRQYSSGMYVRLAFAAAINVDPDVLIIDEALAVGDARYQLKCFLKLREFQEKGKNIIFVSHDLNTIKSYCSNAILLDKGALIFKGIPNDAINLYTKISFSEDNGLLDTEDAAKKDCAKSSLVLSDKEYRYGTGEGEIVSLRLLTSNGLQSTVFTSGEKITVILFAITKRNIMGEPIFGLTIKDSKGQDIYMTNTHYKGMALPPLSKGSEIEISFTLELNLMPSTYFISVGFVEMMNGNIVPLDRRYDIVEIRILPQVGDLSCGIANLQSEITFKISKLNDV